MTSPLPRRIGPRPLLPRLLVLICGVLLATRAKEAAAFAGHRDDRGDELGRRGIELRKRGDDQAALPLLQEAYRQARSPRNSAQLGFCHQALGQWLEAEARLKEALDAPNDPWVNRHLPTLQKSIGYVKAHLARVEVLGDPRGAEVLVNASVVGRLPLDEPVRVAEGETSIELRTQGRIVATKSFRIEGGHYQKIVLRPEAPGRAPAADDRATAIVSPNATAMNHAALDEPRDLARRPPAPTERDSSPEDEPPRLRLAAKWIAWGAATAGAGLGLYAVIRNRSLIADFDDRCGVDAGGVARGAASGTSDAQCAEIKNVSESASLLSVLGFAAAGTLAGLGVVLWLTEPSDDEAETPSTAALRVCAPTLGPRLEPGLGCTFRF